MFYITVSNGLLDGEHEQAMQVNGKTTALWLYLWFLDKMTSIDKKTGLGAVLGGKPIKLDDIKLKHDIKTIRKMFTCLEKGGYIVTKRTPYGRIVHVTKAKKIFGQCGDKETPQCGRAKEVEKHHNAVGLEDKKMTTIWEVSRPQSGRSLKENDHNLVGLIKTIQGDKTVDIPDAQSAPIDDLTYEYENEKKKPQKRSDPTRTNCVPATPFQADEWVNKLLASNQRHVRVLGMYLKEKRKHFGQPNPTNEDQGQSIIKRHVRDAKQVGLFENDAIIKAVDKAFAFSKDEATLSTVLKYLTK